MQARRQSPLLVASLLRRRFLRIFPLYYAVLFASFVIDLEPVRETIAWHVSYLSNFYFVKTQSWGGPISHFWSLDVEEQFYLFWPLVLLFVPSRAVFATAEEGGH